MLEALNSSRIVKQHIGDPVYLNNPNYVKRKVVVFTQDNDTQTDNSANKGPVNEQEVEN